MELPIPAARLLGPGDRDALAAFRCSRGQWYEDDVEAHIARSLVDRHAWRREHTDHTIIGLELPAHGLIAVAAHEVDLIEEAGVPTTSTFLEVAAVALAVQGAVLPEVEPLDEDERPVTLGRYLMEVLMSAVVATDRAPVVRGIVARDNVRSLRLCDRAGMIAERNDVDERFVQRVGRIEA